MTSTATPERPEAAPRVPTAPPSVPPPPPTTGAPVTDVFSPREVAKLLGLTPSRLRSLDKADVVSPSAMRNGRKAYTFQDLIALRATHTDSAVVRQVATRVVEAASEAFKRVSRAQASSQRAAQADRVDSARRQLRRARIKWDCG